VCVYIYVYVYIYIYVEKDGLILLKMNILNFSTMQCVLLKRENSIVICVLIHPALHAYNPLTGLWFYDDDDEDFDDNDDK
jgi:hypothetical protein